MRAWAISCWALATLTRCGVAADEIPSFPCSKTGIRIWGRIARIPKHSTLNHIDPEVEYDFRDNFSSQDRRPLGLVVLKR